MIDPSTLDPGILAWMARIGEISATLPPLDDELDFPARRARERELSDRLAEEFTRPIDAGAEITDVEIAGRPAHLIRPRDAQTPLATQVYLHGGGFVSGTAAELVNDAVLSERAVAAGIQIVSLDYRLAPEHPYPAAVDDAIAVLTALATEERWAADATRLAVGGASAGGHIAAVAALRLRAAARAAASAAPTLAHVLLEIPALDFTTDWPSMREFASDDEIAGALAVAAAYRGPGEADAFFSPVRVADLTGLPRTFVMTAELDPLRDAAEEYARRLAAAGVDARLRRGEGQLHGTAGLTAVVASSREWQSAAIDELRSALNPDLTP